MAKMQSTFQEALKGKKIPMLILDNKWYQLFTQMEKTASMKKNEQKLNELVKQQGHLTTESKEIRKLKKRLMQEIVDLMEEESASADRKTGENRRLIEECNAKLESHKDELMDLPGKIDKINYDLMLETMEICYQRLHENAKMIEEVGAWITSMRIELKKKIVRKQEREIESQQLYAYMHDIFGADIIEVFDMQYMPLPKASKKKSVPAGEKKPPH